MNLFRKLSAYKATIRTYSKDGLDVEKLFLNPQINNLLQNLIDRDPLKVHKSSLRKRENPTIHLLSNDQHKELEAQNSTLTKQKLQMPPVKNVRIDKVEIIENNDKLNRFLPPGNKIAFVDIGMQSKIRDRMMVVRESDGILRTATWAERDRLNQVYFPLPSKEIIPPPMFNDDNLLALMNEGKYAYILDRNCIQFEPDDPAYISICHNVYRHVNDHSDKLQGFRVLSSTRHFGGLVLHLVLENNVGPVLLYLLGAERLAAVESLLRLYCLIYTHSELAAAMVAPAERDLLAMVEMLLAEAPVSERQKKQIQFVVDCARETRQLKEHSV